MKITVHRGTDQIGGCVTEYEHKGFRLFVDYGEQLPGAKKSGLLEIEGLTKGDLSKSALLITHYHGDHIGCIDRIPAEIPIYIGEMGREIQLVLSQHLASVDGLHKNIIARLEQASTFTPGTPFPCGPFTIMPVVVDHSAFDAYAFKIEADGVKVLHTGDFRTHGFRSGRLSEMIEQYVGQVDYVVCEGTNVARPNATSVAEWQLQKEFEGFFRENKGNVVYVASTNIDRIFALYHAALRAGRPFYVDAYQHRIMDVVVKNKHVWSKSKLYKYGQYEPTKLLFENGEFKVKDEFKDFLDKKGYVLIARANPRFNKLIDQMSGEKVRYLSMWKGYLDKAKDAYNEELAEALGKDYKYLHTSGHCDMDSLRDFFAMLQPKAIIPIHTDQPEEFAKLFCDKWPVIRLHDGESISPLSSRMADTCAANIFCMKELDGNATIVNTEDGEKGYSLDAKFIGAFKTIKDSEFVLKHTLYRPEAVVGYEVNDEEDAAPSNTQTYDTQMNLLATYTYGEHHPGGAKYQEACKFAKGEKVFAVFHAPYYAVVPSKVIGAITPDAEKENWEQNDPKDYYDSYEDYVKDWDDWHWDSVAVHPLVRLKSGYEQMTDTETVPRIHLFPLR